MVTDNDNGQILLFYSKREAGKVPKPKDVQAAPTKNETPKYSTKAFDP